MKKLTNIAAVLLALFLLPQTASAAKLLIPGGQVIGIRLGDPLTVAAFDTASAARDAGMEIGDRVTHINNIKVQSVKQLRQAVKQAGDTVSVRFLRNGESQTLSVPLRAGLLGIYMKQCVTGLGTVTYYDPISGDFGALGHG